MKTFLFIFCSLLLSDGYAQTQPLPEKKTEQQQIEDAAIIDFMQEESQEKPAPLEPPYADAELVQLQKDEKKKEKKKAYKPLPSVYDQLPDQPLDDGSRIKKRYIKHPLAEKGLYRITKDGDYLYSVEKTPQQASIAVRLGIFDAPNLVSRANSATFSDLYGGNDPMVLFTYEWKLDNWMRNLTFNLGSGLVVALGNGRLETGTSAGQESKEKFTMVMLPNHAGLGYKFKYSDTQKIVPYVEGGGHAFVFTEHRDDGDPAFGRWGGAFAFYAAGGLAFNITELDRDSSIRLDAEYGINGVAFTVEVRQLLGGLGTFDFTTTLLNAGVVVYF